MIVTGILIREKGAKVCTSTPDYMRVITIYISLATSSY